METPPTPARVPRATKLTLDVPTPNSGPPRPGVSATFCEIFHRNGKLPVDTHILKTNQNEKENFKAVMETWKPPKAPGWPFPNVRQSPAVPGVEALQSRPMSVPKATIRPLLPAPTPRSG